MKRFIVSMLAVVLCMTMLFGCSSVKNVDLQTVFDDINTQFSISDLTVIEEAEKLNRYYQIDETKVEQFAAEFSIESSVFTEIVLIQAVNEDAAKEIANALNNHYQTRLAEAKSYNAEQVSMLEKCSVQQNGTYVSLIIGDKAEEMSAVYNSYFE